MLTKKNLTARRGKVGASDVPALFGMSRYKDHTPLAIYNRIQERQEIELSMAMILGNTLEHGIAEFYSMQMMPEQWDLKPSKDTCQHKRIQRFICHPDFFITKENGDAGLLEIKKMATRKEWGEPGTDEVPNDVLLQVQAQMRITGIDECRVAVLFGGHTVEEYCVARSEKLGKSIEKKVEEFLERIDKRQPPDPITYKESLIAYGALSEDTVLADGELEDLFYETKRLKKEVKGIEDRIEENKLALSKQMKGKTTLCTHTGEILCRLSDVHCNRLNIDRLRKELPEIYAEYVEPSKSRRMSMK